MTDLISVAVELMLLGMGTVFVFLVALIGATKLMSSFVLSSQTEEKEEHTPTEVLGSPIPAALNPATDARLVEVIKQAIQQHRSR
jgi:oxaloacetate decarboxylase gamma subunit